MELLIAKDPAIFKAMLNARKNVDGLREFAKRIDALKPGLYSKLSLLKYDDNTLYDEFLEGALVVIDELYDGDQHKADHTIAMQKAA